MQQLLWQQDKQCRFTSESVGLSAVARVAASQMTADGPLHGGEEDSINFVLDLASLAHGRKLVNFSKWSMIVLTWHLD